MGLSPPTITAPSRPCVHGLPQHRLPGQPDLQEPAQPDGRQPSTQIQHHLATVGRQLTETRADQAVARRERPRGNRSCRCG